MIGVAIGFLESLRQVLDSRHCSPKVRTSSPGLWLPCFCSCGFHRCAHLLEPLPLSLALQPAHLLLLPLLMTLGLEAIFSISLLTFSLFIHSSPEFGEHLYDHYFELFIR